VDDRDEQGFPDVPEEEMEQAASIFQAWTRNIHATVSLLRVAVPELSAEIEAQRDAWLRKGVVPLIDDVFLPHLHRLLAGGTDRAALLRAFEFEEQLAAHPDESIACAAMLTIRALAAQTSALEQARGFMGPFTLAWLEKYEVESAATVPGHRHRLKRRFDTLPFGPDMRLDAYPTVEQLRRGAILWTIAEAVYCAGTNMPSYERGWNGSTYWLDNHSHARGAVEFGEEGVVACFFGRDTDRNPRGERHAYEPRRYIAGMPERLERLAERTVFGYVLDDWRGRTMPLITASCWSDGHRLTAPEPWDDVMKFSGELLAGHVLEPAAMLHLIAENYAFSPRQLAVVRSLFRRRMASGGEPVKVAPREQAIIAREGASSFDWVLDTVRRTLAPTRELPPEATARPGVAPTRDLLAPIGIIWPGPPTPAEDEDEGDRIPPPYRLVAVPAITRDEILRRLDALDRRHAARDDGDALELMLAFTESQADADLLYDRYGQSRSEGIRISFMTVRARYHRPSSP
jgi:hypothetical protein